MKYKANILVVDDDRAACKSIANILVHEGYSVDMAGGGDEALAMEAKKEYAMVIADLKMPGVSGLDLLKQLKTRNPDLTVIIITGYPSIKTAVESIKESAFDYIPKPFTPGELRDMVSRALERRFNFEEIAAKAGLSEKKLVEIVSPDKNPGSREKE